MNDNQFYGSLEPLKDMIVLEELYIFNTDICSGLEYLPDSLSAPLECNYKNGDIFKKLNYFENQLEVWRVTQDFYQKRLTQLNGELEIHIKNTKEMIDGARDERDGHLLRCRKTQLALL